jgi:hypothetical protein
MTTVTKERHDRFTKLLGPEIPHRSRGEIADLRRDVYEAFQLLAKDPDFDYLHLYNIKRVINSLDKLHSDSRLNTKRDRLLTACAFGNLVMEINQADRDVPIAGPNAGGFKRTLALTLKAPKGEIVNLDGEITPTIVGVKVGAGFDAPTLSPATPKFVHGRCKFDLVYDDGTYAADDTVGAEVDLTVAGTALTQVIYTDTMIA